MKCQSDFEEMWSVLENGDLSVFLECGQLDIERFSHSRFRTVSFVDDGSDIPSVYRLQSKRRLDVTKAYVFRVSWGSKWCIGFSLSDFGM